MIARRATPVSHIFPTIWCVLCDTAGDTTHETVKRYLSRPTLSLFSSRSPPMLLYPILVLSLIAHPTSAQPAKSSTSTTGGPLLLPSGGSGRGSDTGNVGSAVGGERVISPDPIEHSGVYFRIPIRGLCGSRSYAHDCAGVCDAPLVTKAKLPVPQ